MADEWTGEWLRREIAEKTGAEVWDVLRSFTVDGRNVNLIHMPGAGYALVAHDEHGEMLLGKPEQSVRTMLATVQWHKVQPEGRTGKVW